MHLLLRTVMAIAVYQTGKSPMALDSYSRRPDEEVPLLLDTRMRCTDVNTKSERTGRYPMPSPRVGRQGRAIPVRMLIISDHDEQKSPMMRRQHRTRFSTNRKARQ